MIWSQAGVKKLSEFIEMLSYMSKFAQSPIVGEIGRCSRISIA